MLPNLHSERATQNRNTASFWGKLGSRNLGDWTARVANCRVDDPLLNARVTKAGCTLTSRQAMPHEHLPTSI